MKTKLFYIIINNWEDEDVYLIRAKNEQSALNKIKKCFNAKSFEELFGIDKDRYLSIDINDINEVKFGKGKSIIELNYPFRMW